MPENIDFKTWHHTINNQKDFLEENFPNVDYSKIMAQINTLKVQNKLSNNDMDLIIEGYRVFHLKKLPR